HPGSPQLWTLWQPDEYLRPLSSIQAKSERPVTSGQLQQVFATRNDMKIKSIAVMVGLLWLCSGVSDSGPSKSDFRKTFTVRLPAGGQQDVVLKDFPFKGNERACVIVEGD